MPNYHQAFIYLNSGINNNNRWGLIYFTTKIDDVSNEIYLAFNGGGNNYIIQQAGPILTPPGQINNPNLSLQRFSANVWMHIAFTVDSSRVTRYYLNGVENCLSYILAALPASINRPYNYFGRDYSFDGYTNGAYDDIKIYYGAMDSASIMNDYINSLKPPTITTITTTSTTTTAKPVPVLINSWLFNGDYSDSVGGANITGGVNYGLTKDRFGYPNSALSLTNGYAQLPQGVYFSGPYTVTVWIYPMTYQSNSLPRIFEFTNRAGDAVLFGLYNTIPQWLQFSDYQCIGDLKSSISLAFNSQWIHLALTLDMSGAGTLYINGVPNVSKYMGIPKNVIREYNFFGKTQAWLDPYPVAYYDDIKIYKGAMDSNSIMNDYINSSKPPITTTTTTTTKTTTTTAKPGPILLNSWSFNGDYSDSVGGANLKNGLNYGLTSDRFGNPNSALNLNYGYMNIPPGIYFNGTFTITTWAYLRNYVKWDDWTTIVYFGTGYNDWTNSIFEVFCSGNNNIIKSVGEGNPQQWDSNSNLILQSYKVGQWMHIAFTLDSNLIAKYYINGIQSRLLDLPKRFPQSINRPNSYIGKSDLVFSPPLSNANAIYDDLKIYLGAMDGTSVMNDYITSLKQPTTTTTTTKTSTTKTTISTSTTTTTTTTKTTTTTAKPGPALLNSWSFNGDYNDSVGGANLKNGLNYGLTSDRFGNPNSALNLNYGYMSIPPGIYFNGTFTITAWVYVKNRVNLNDWLTIVYFGTGYNDWTNSVFTVFNGGDNNYILKSAGPANPQINDPNGNLIRQRFSIGVWMHTAFTLDSNLQAKNYINGIQSNLIDLPKSFPQSMNRPNSYIGKSDLVFSPPLSNANAIYDDIKIYLGAMDSASVMNDYITSLKQPVTTTSTIKTTTTATTTTTKTTTAKPTTTTVTAKPGPILLNSWSFNGDYTDSVGGANVIDGSNYGLTNDRYGNPNSVLNLTNGYVQLPPGVYFSGPFTVTVWVYAIQISQSDKCTRIFEFSNGGGVDAVLFCLWLFKPNFYNFIGSNPSQLTSSVTVTKSTWTHLAFTLDSAGTGTIYINGVPNVSKYMSLPNNVKRTLNYFGKSQWNDPYPFAYYDDLKIYKGAMDSVNIMNDYITSLKPPQPTTKTTAKPILKLINSWSFNGNYNDPIGGANLTNGINFGLAQDRFGKLNSALNLTNGYVILPSGIYFNGGPFSISVWVNIQSLSATSKPMRIFEFGNGLGKDQVLLYLTNGTQPTGSIFDNNKNEINKIVSNISLKLFDWNYIVYTQDKLGKSTIYINGIPDKSSIQLIPNGILRQNNYLGHNSLDKTNAFAIIDEFKIYNGVLDSNIILNEYNSYLKTNTIFSNK